MYTIIDFIDDENRSLITEIKKVDEAVNELKKKYYDRRPSVNAQYIREFFNYKLSKDEIIKQVWNTLKSLARKIVVNDSEMKKFKKEKKIYERLLSALSSEYSVIIDAQRN